MYFLLQKNKGRKFIKSILQMKESKVATFLVTFMYVMIKLSYVPQILHVLNIFSKKRCQLHDHCRRKHPWGTALF